MEFTNIYSLEFPEGNIRYIGKADNLDDRLKGHINKRKLYPSHKNSWIQGLVNNGNKLIIKLVEEVPVAEWEFWERYYISLYKSWGFNLTNSTPGGECGTLYEHSKRKISETLKERYKKGEIKVWNEGRVGEFAGENHFNRNRKRSDENKAKISNTKKEYYKDHDVWNKGKQTGQVPWNKGKKGVMPIPWNKGKKGEFTSWNKGVKMKESSKSKMIENNPFRKEIIQFSLNGEFIKEHYSLAEANKDTSINGISQCCNDKARSAGGFLWIYKKDFESNPELLGIRVNAFKNKDKNMARGSGSKSPSAKKVIQIDPITNKEIKVWDSIVEAKKNFDGGDISKACRDGIKAKGFYWKYL